MSCINFNEVATRVWELIDGQRTVGDIVAVVTDEYEVEPAVAEADILAFLDELLQKDLIKRLSRRAGLVADVHA